VHCILGHFSTLLDLQALASIGQLTTLTELRIASCNKLTVNGTPHLAGLTRMQVTPLRSPALPLCCMQGRVVRCHGSSMVHRASMVAGLQAVCVAQHAYWASLALPISDRCRQGT